MATIGYLTTTIFDFGAIKPNSEEDIVAAKTGTWIEGYKLRSGNIMSHLGQNRKSRPCGGMSASRPKADIARTFPEVRFVPEGDLSVGLLFTLPKNLTGQTPADLMKARRHFGRQS